MAARKDGKSEDLRNMLMSFRIAELQTLLGSCGRSRSGRKHELMGRAVNLLKNADGTMRERVRTRILELYNQRFPPQASATGAASASTYHQPYVPYTEEKDQEPTYLNRAPYHDTMNTAPTSVAAACHGYTPPQGAPHRQQGGLYDNMPHIQSHRVAAPVSALPMPVHPDVRFIKLPFYDLVDVLIKPTSLVQKTLIGVQDVSIVYHLTPYQTQLIQNSRSFSVKTSVDFGVQVQLRFCLAETSCVQEDLYPSKCKIFVNNKGTPLPGQPPPNAQNQEPRKPHRPINITSLCRLTSMQSNNIHIQWTPSDGGQRFAATIHLVKTVQTSALVQQLKSKPPRSQEHTIDFIKEKLRQGPDSEIALTSLKVSLCCPIGMARMSVPCRANNCNHLQCFDGANYIMMNERKPSWVCPVCDQKAHLDQIFIDGMFKNILKDTKDCDDIVFFEDGSWRPLSDTQDTQTLSQILTPKAVPLPERVDSDLENSRKNITDKNPPPLLLDVPSTSRPQHPVAVSIASHHQVIPPPASVTAAPSLHPSPVATSGSAVEEEEEEVIIIDDSDSEDNMPLQSMIQPRINRDKQTQPLDAQNSFPFCDSQAPSELGLDFYSLLPHEDRIAAAMYLDQAGVFDQMPRTSPSVIDISDE